MLPDQLPVTTVQVLPKLRTKLPIQRALMRLKLLVPGLDGLVQIAAPYRTLAKGAEHEARDYSEVVRAPAERTE